MDPGVTIARLSDIPDEHGLLLNDTDSGPISPPTFDFTTDTHRRCRIKAVRFQLLTQAGAAARRPRLQILDGATELWRIDCRATQAAFQTRAYNFSPTTRDDTAFIANELQTTLPPNFYLPPGFTLRISITGAPGTDELGPIEIITENWIDG